MKEKAYRIEVTVKGHEGWGGLFDKMDYEEMGIPDGLYEELMYPINGRLRVPSGITGIKQFWFTQEGWGILEKYIMKLINTVNEETGGYFTKLRVLTTDTLKDIQYQDEHQIGLGTLVVKNAFSVVMEQTY